MVLKALGATLLARLKAATAEELEQWAENILDATMLEEVFKDL